MADLDVKIVDLILHGTPVMTKSGFAVLAEFTLLVAPVRLRNCKLVRAPNNRLLIWTPSEDAKIMGSRLDELAAIVSGEIKEFGRELHFA